MIPALTAQSKTAAKPQLRFGGAYVPNGVLPDRWHPSTTGRDFDFKPAMKPLEPFREMLFTVSGMVGSGTPGPASRHGGCGWLNGLGAVGKQGEPIVSGKSLDQFIADRIGQDTPMPSIEVGTEDMGTSLGACDGFACTYFNAVSWKSDTSPRPVEINPRVTFEQNVRRDGQQPGSASPAWNIKLQHARFAHARSRPPARSTRPAEISTLSLGRLPGETCAKSSAAFRACRAEAQ